MDKKRATINILVGVFFKVLILLFSIFTKSFLVKYIGDEANGLYSLYISIIGFVTIANLGVGSAIIYSMYKPIVENNTDEVTALYFLYRKFYLIVFLVIMGLGTILTPFVPLLAKGSHTQNIYLTYFIFLVSTAITYLYGHKVSLINAYKDNYITTLTSSITRVLDGIIQILVLVYTRNFVYFLLTRLITHALEGILIDIIYRKKYAKRLNYNRELSDSTRKEVIKNSTAKMYSEVGTKLISSFDGIIISTFVGVIVLANYSNYLIVISGMWNIISLVFSEITSVIGQFSVNQEKETLFKQYKRLFAINFIIGLTFFLGFVATSHNIIEIIFSKEHVESNILMFALTFDFFINFMRWSTYVFKDALGIFYPDRHRPLIEGILNIIISIILVKYIGVTGVLFGTALIRLTISYTIETKVLFKYAFGISIKKFLVNMYLTVVVFVGAVFVFKYTPNLISDNVLVQLIYNGIKSLSLTMIILVLIYMIYKPFRDIINDLFRVLINMIRKRKKLSDSYIEGE